MQIRPVPSHGSLHQAPDSQETAASGIKIGSRRHLELEQAAAKLCPTWLVDAVRRRWPDVDLTDRRVDQAVLVRSVSPFGYGRASYELNLGCNYDCGTATWD